MPLVIRPLGGRVIHIADKVKITFFHRVVARLPSPVQIHNAGADNPELDFWPKKWYTYLNYSGK